MMRVLHLNSLLTGGGTDHQCAVLAHGLCQLGLRVWVAGPRRGEVARMLEELAVPLFDTGGESPLKLLYIWRVARFIRRQQIQIVHSHHGRDYWPAILAARLSGVRPTILLTRHLAKSPSSWFSRRYLLGQCDALIAVSHFAAKVLREGFYEPHSIEPERRARPPLRGDPAKIHVIYGGIDTDRFRPAEAMAQRREWGLEPGHFAFAVVGGYDLPRGKGQREFLQAAAQIYDQVPNARFLLVGRGNMAGILRTDIQRLGLSGKATVTPNCRDMSSGMNAIDCLVHPQVGTEALGLVVCEAHACGRPVIASALDGIPEAFAIGGCGELVPPGSVPALAQAMLRQLRQPALTQAGREELHARIQRRFSLPLCAQAVGELYRRLRPKSMDSTGPIR